MKQANQNILLTFTGFHDPFGAAAVEGTEQEGPILSLLRAKRFDRVVLFSTSRSLLLLAASGEIPARILSVRPPRFVSGDRTVVTEIDLSRPEFPSIRPRVWSDLEAPFPEERDPSDVIRRLGIVGNHPSFLSALE